MDTWEEILASVNRCLGSLAEQGCPDPYFRGHSDARWKLLPQLARRGFGYQEEVRLYCRFRALGSHLFPPDFSSWDVLFLMRHHGIPTRLLDWTESFAIALYFAISGGRSDCAVWVLNPYALNKRTHRDESVENLNSDYPRGYADHFLRGLTRRPRFPAAVLAVEGSSRVARMQSQRSAFTLHRDLSIEIDQKHPAVVTKITIPQSLIPEARRFLHLSGINQFSVFPDLDGLAKYLEASELDEELGPGA